MRALIRLALVNDATLQSLGVTAAGVVMGEVDSIEERPFLNLRWGATLPGLDVVSRRTLDIWVHDQGTDYEAKVDPIIRRIHTILAGLEATPHTSGYLVKAEWTGDSGDLADDGHGTITRTTSYSLVGTGQ